ncbi:MAG: PH domain-containing protein [Clostridium sp.]|nr:PH domain-containing protein [Clostridium sp.]MDY3813275.1 PH domain-containing protein [Candidatus Copromonas sp.]
MNSKYSRYITGILIMVLVFVIAIRMQSSSSVSIDFNDDQIVITGPETTEPISIAYQAIQSVTLLDHYTIGEKLSGIENRRLSYGTFKNDEYGIYSLCAVPSIASVIEIRTDHNVILFNYESEKVTAALSSSMADFVREKQN